MIHAGPSEYSLWLMPGKVQLAELTALVQELAPQFDQLTFIPHVTIQGDLAMRLDALTTYVQKLASILAVQRWKVQGVESTDAFFRCFYLRFSLTPAFEKMQQASHRFSRTSVGLAPYPHLSLAYGQMHAGHDTLRNQVESRFMGEELVFDHLCVSRSSKDVPISEWTVLENFPLLPSHLN